MRRSVVTKIRNYGVLDVQTAKQIATVWLDKMQLTGKAGFGLPEIDDRYHIWRVPLIRRDNQARLGEAVIDAFTSLIVEEKSTALPVLEARLAGNRKKKMALCSSRVEPYSLSSLRNTIAGGDSEQMLQELPAKSINLIFTSPPYYNARPEYTDYVTYEEYLLKLRKIIQNCHRLLAEGCFFVINVSPVLVRRASRSESSRRIAVPFDIHRLFIEEGYEFIDDIIWEKPAGAGWATSRGRRFAADRNPLQYKTVPVTEYVLVYRKKTDKLIDWNIRNHPDQKLVKGSKIGGDYERTNIWKIKPAHDPRHPAIFPSALAEKVITYYSFQNDVVLDPFAGIGTVGKAAAKLGRRFVLIEKKPEYLAIIREEAKRWLGKEAENILTINCAPISSADQLF